MKKTIGSEIGELSIEELKRRFQVLAQSVEAMGEAGRGLLEALQPGYLPEPVLNDVAVKTRPFTAAIRKMQADCLGFQQYADLFNVQLEQRTCKPSLNEFWGAPVAGKAVN